MKQVDFLIIGQGICGSIVAYELLKRQFKILVVDEQAPVSSSRIAAGLFSPVTGRKMVKTWLFDDIFPYAFSYYPQLENELGCKFFHPESLHHVLSSVKEVNDLSERFSREEYQSLAVFDQLHQLGELVQAPLGTLRLNHCGWCEVNMLLEAVAQVLIKKHVLRHETFHHTLLQQTNDGWTYGDTTASGVIFCEGHRMRQNPYFNFTDMRPAKGEIITLHAPELNLKEIIKQHYWIIPTGEHLFKVGATFDFNTINETPTKEARELLTGVFEQFFSTPYTVVKHEAAIRPAMHDRRPVLGKHPEYEGLYIFNGMGAKGVTQVPYLTSLFIDYLIHAGTLPKEVSISRFVD
jgi:glycine/D-amino acid oxidase-like deaminating enzyme